MKTVISIVLIISISLLTVMLPIQIGSITTDVSATGLSFASLPVNFIAWLIAMLASMGITVSSLSDFEEVLQGAVGQSLVSDLYDKWQNGIPAYKWGSMTALEYLLDREKIALWAFSDEVTELPSKTTIEYINDVLSGDRVIYYEGQKVVALQQGESFTGVIGWDSATFDGKVDILENIGHLGFYSNIYKSDGYRPRVAYTNSAGGGRYKSVTLYYAESFGTRVMYSTSYNYDTTALMPYRTGFMYYIKPAIHDYQPDQNNLIASIYMYPVAMSKIGENVRVVTTSESYTLLKSVYSDEPLVPQIHIDAHKLAQTVTADDVATNDKVNITIPDRLIEQLTDAYTNQTIPKTEVDMPQAVPVSTTNYYISNITNTMAAEAELDLDFPELDSFRMPTGITAKFPFSIPFDVGRAFDMMVAPAQAPVFVLPFTIQRLNIHHDITLDLTEWESVAEVVRWFLLAIFILILVVVTRKLIKG